MVQNPGLKVLHVGWGHPPGMAAGPVYYVHNLCLHQHACGIDSSCFVARVDQSANTGAPSLSLMKHENVNYYLAENRPAYYFDWENPRRETENREIETLFSRVLKEFRPSIVHFHNLVGLSMSLPDIAYHFDCKTVLSIHNYWMMCPRDDLFATNEQVCYGPLDGARCASCVGNLQKTEDFMYRVEQSKQILNKSVDVILAVSDRVKQILIGYGVKEQKIIVQHIGSIAAEKNWHSLGTTKTLENVNHDIIKFAAIGILVVRKGFHVIVEAVKNLEHKRGRFLIEVYGGGMNEAYIQRLKKMFYGNNFLNESFVFKGPYNQPDLPKILQGVDIAIIAPIWEDNAPQTVMESLGGGVPVIGSRIGGIPDFVIDGKNGLLFQPGNPSDLARAMQTIIDDKTLIGSFRRNIKEPLTMSKHVDEVSYIYNHIAKENNNP
jgi:glycosyltransferase involved in cell wall biosynthesis